MERASYRHRFAITISATNFFRAIADFFLIVELFLLFLA